MGRLSYTFACAPPDMKSPSWIETHRKNFEYLGGVPVVVILDYVVHNIIQDFLQKSTESREKKDGVMEMSSEGSSGIILRRKNQKSEILPSPAMNEVDCWRRRVRRERSA
jgi:transposase